MATFNGTDLGIIEEPATMPAPNDFQLNAYPGVNGIEALNLGSRGGTSMYKAALYASTPANLDALFAVFRGYVQAGGASTLVDAYGTTWTNVILRNFRPTGPRKLLANGDGVIQRCEYEFLHTS